LKSKENFFDILYSSLIRMLFTGDKSLLSTKAATPGYQLPFISKCAQWNPEKR